MRRNSIWQLIRNDIRSSARSRGRKRSKRKRSKGFWQGVGDTVLFQPHKSDTLSIWRDTYKLKRQLREMERRLTQPPTEETWRTALKDKFRSTVFDVIDEVKAVLTALGFHIATLVLVVVCNIVWFALLFWVIGVWLG